MADPQGLIGYPGVQAPISGSFTLTHGITPSHAQIVCAQQTAPLPSTGPLTIYYGSLQWTFQNCLLDSMSFEADPRGGYTWKLNLFDRRWKWKNAYVTGFYNLRWPGGQTDMATERSPMDLLKMCFAALRETNYDLSAIGSVNWIRPEVHWDHDPAAHALQDIAGQLGCRVVLGADDVVRVLPTGLGSPLPGGDVEAVSQSVVPPQKPEALLFVAGPSRYQIDTWLEPVGLDVDGLIKPLNQLSYAPKTNKVADWSKTGPPFADLDALAAKAVAGEIPGGGIKSKARELALQTVYRWYRIREVPLGIEGDVRSNQNGMAGGGPVDPKALGFAPPLTVPGYDPVIKSRLQLLPIEDEQVETSTDPNAVVPRADGAPALEGTPKNKRAVVWGQFDKSGGTTGVNIKTTDINFPGFFPAFGDPRVECTMPWTMDRAEGVIRFAKPLYRMSKINDILPGNIVVPSQRVWPAFLALRCACTLRDTNTRAPLRYTQVRQIDQAGNGVAVIRHEHVQANYWGERSASDNSFRKLHSTETESIIPGVPPVKQEADYYLDAAAKAYQIGNPQEGTYSGLVPISPDGAIQSVSWSTSESGAVTKASRNCELAHVVYPYRQRVQDAALSKIRLDGYDLAVKMARAIGKDATVAKMLRMG